MPLRSRTSGHTHARIRPRIVYIAFYFPPTRASGVYRSRATANHLAEAGWDVTVVTPQREFFTDYIESFDPSLEATVRGDVQVDRVRFPGRAWEKDIRSWSRMRANVPQLSGSVNSWVETRAFPEQYSPWIPRVVKRVVELHRRAPVDLVLATGNPFASFAAAWAVNRLTRVPYVVDYRDSWTLNLFQDAPAYPDGHPAWAWERRILARAAAAVFVNEPLRAWHVDRYPFLATAERGDRTLVVQNGWEPDLLGALPDPAPVTPTGAGPDGAPGRPLRFGYMGTLTTHVPVEPFLDGWRAARAADPRMADSTMHVFGHLGFFPASVPALRAKLPHDGEDGVHVEGPVPKAQVGTAYASLDVLVLMLAGGRYVTSGKVYEYMASGRPIVSVHDPVSAANGPLQGYPLWFPVRDLSGEEVARVLREAADAARTADPALRAAARAHAARYTRDAQLADFQVELRRIAGYEDAVTVRASGASPVHLPATAAVQAVTMPDAAPADLEISRA